MTRVDRVLNLELSILKKNQSKLVVGDAILTRLGTCLMLRNTKCRKVVFADAWNLIFNFLSRPKICLPNAVIPNVRWGTKYIKIQLRHLNFPSRARKKRGVKCASKIVCKQTGDVLSPIESSTYGRLLKLRFLFNIIGWNYDETAI